MINIACAADSGFLPHSAAMVHSVLVQHSAGEVKVHFLHDDSVPSADIELFSEFVRSCGGEWRSCEVSPEQRDRCPHNKRFGRVAWYRVFLPELIPELDRVLYLDADIIVRRPLTTLWCLGLENRPLGAVVNPLYPFMDMSFLENLKLSPREYFNSGVLLFDLEAWRKQSLTDRVLLQAIKQGDQEWPDQNALNIVLQGQWLSLPPEWNAQNTIFDLPARKLPFPPEVVAHARVDPAIIHYIGPYKPWHYRCKHSLRELYWKHLVRTPWKDMAMQGDTVANRLLRMLPEQWSWRFEALVKEWRSSRRGRR